MTRDQLRNAETEVLRNSLDRVLVIDADVHHLDVIPHLTPYMDPFWRQAIESAGDPGVKYIGDRSLAWRIQRTSKQKPGGWPPLSQGSHPPAQITRLVSELTRIGVDYSILFPNDMLTLALYPQAELEVAVAKAYARWATEEVLPYEPRIWSMLYLPFSDPKTSLQLIEKFGSKPGVVGFLVTGNRNERIHHNEWMPVFAALEERNLTLGFHAVGYWGIRPFNMFDTFLTAHSLSFPIYNAIHLFNLVLGGVAERFPDLRIVFFEAGAAIMPLLMARLDTAFMMRPSEAPLLKKKPSEYMKEFFYTIQPIEHPDKPGQLQAIFDAIGRKQILFATDYPHWDCDMPGAISELGFLSQSDQEGIFHGNAIRAFDLDPGGLTMTDWKKSLGGDAGRGKK